MNGSLRPWVELFGLSSNSYGILPFVLGNSAATVHILIYTLPR